MNADEPPLPPKLTPPPLPPSRARQPLPAWLKWFFAFIALLTLLVLGAAAVIIALIWQACTA